MSWSYSDLAQHRDAVGVGELVVEQDEVDALAHLLERPRARLRLEDLIALTLEPLGQRPADQGFVIDNENGWRWHMAGSGAPKVPAQAAANAGDLRYFSESLG